MPAGLRLEVVTQSAAPALCALCGEMFDSPSAAVILYDGSLPLGHVCPECLSLRPQQAAVRIRAHAQKLRTLAEYGWQLAAEQWALMAQMVMERADKSFVLADRIANLDSWNLKE